MNRNKISHGIYHCIGNSIVSLFIATLSSFIYTWDREFPYKYDDLSINRNRYRFSRERIQIYGTRLYTHFAVPKDKPKENIKAEEKIEETKSPSPTEPEVSF